MSEPWNDYASPTQDDGPWSDYVDNLTSRAVAKKPSFWLGAYQGGVKALDNVAVGLESAADQIPGVSTESINRSLGMPSARDARSEHREAVARSGRTPSFSGQVAGEVVGTLPAAALKLPGAMAVANPFVQGAAQGAALSDSETPGGVGWDAAVGAGVNWFGGKAVDAVADAVSPIIDPAVRRLSDAGVKMTPGMIKGGKAMGREDKKMSRPIVGDAIRAGRSGAQETFNSAGVNKALAPLGKKVPAGVKPGFDSISYAKDEIRRAYDVIVPNLTVKIDGQAFAKTLMPLAATLEPAQKKQLQAIISTKLKNGQLSGQALKDAQGELRRLASQYGRDDNAANRELARVLGAADDELTGAMMAQNPKWAPELAKANEAYRGYRIVADASGRADDGLYNTGQLKQAVRRGDRSKSKDATGRGDAFFQEFSNDARNVLPSQTPNSGTVDRQQASNLFAKLGGGLEAGEYAFDNLYQRSRLVPRGPKARKVASGVRRLRGPAAAGAVASAHQSRD